jgi:hypothetical protein
MYTLKYATAGKEVNEIIDRFKQLSLAFQVEESADFEELRLQEGQQTIIGLENIKAHLEELSRELHRWYYCDC